MAHNQRKLIGTFGDVNFLEYGGGLVYRNIQGGFTMVYFDNREYLPESENKPRKWEVFECDLDPNYIDESKLADVGSYCDMTEDELKTLLHSNDPMDVAMVFEQCAMYEGWLNFDQYPELLTKSELNRLFGRWVK